MAAEIILWVSITGLAFIYAGYAFVVFSMNKINRAVAAMFFCAALEKHSSNPSGADLSHAHQKVSRRLLRSATSLTSYFYKQTVPTERKVSLHKGISENAPEEPTVYSNKRSGFCAPEEPPKRETTENGTTLASRGGVGGGETLTRTDTVSYDDLPTVAILIAAFNEEEIIKEKIENTLALDYPANKLKLYVVADGSNDKTNEIISGYSDVTLLYQPARKGKSAAINRAMQFIQEPITIFTDANVMINTEAIKAIVKHYDNKKVGGVSGEKVVMHDERASAASTEGVYWKYESFLKKQDAQLYSIAGAAGEMFSIRTALYEAIPEDTLLDDFQLSMNIIRKGYQIKYEPSAQASENPSLNIAEEYKRKVRIAAGGIQIIERNPDICNPFQYGVFSFQFLIHRVSRWTVAPVFIVTAFLSNLILTNSSNFYSILFVLQLTFHLAAFAGWQLGNRHIKVKALHVPFYFEFMHYCVVMGWIRYFKGNQKAAWQKATRLSYN